MKTNKKTFICVCVISFTVSILTYWQNDSSITAQQTSYVSRPKDPREVLRTNKSQIKLEEDQIQNKQSKNQIQMEEDHVQIEEDHVQSEEDHVQSKGGQVQPEEGQIQPEEDEVQPARDQIHSEENFLQSEDNKIQLKEKQIQSEPKQSLLEEDQIPSKVDQIKTIKNQLQTEQSQIDSKNYQIYENRNLTYSKPNNTQSKNDPAHFGRTENLGFIKSHYNPHKIVRVFRNYSSNKYFYTLSRNFIQLKPLGQNLLERKGLHQVSREGSYSSRLIETKERCKRYNDFKVDLSRFIYDDTRKVVMCVVPKNACTSWKRFFWHFYGRPNFRAINSNYLTLGYGKLKTLSKLPNKTEAFEKLRTYTKFFVKRHPFDRLISAYGSKLSKRSTNREYKIIAGRKIAEMFTPKFLYGIPVRKFIRANISALEKFAAFKDLNDLEKQEVRDAVFSFRTGTVDFKKFASFVIYQHSKASKHLGDVHWRPQTDLCNPCAVEYDYIVDFSNLKQDSDHLLKYLQRSVPKDKQVYFEQQRSAVNGSSTKQTMYTLNPFVLERLTEMYNKDFTVLGYNSSL